MGFFGRGYFCHLLPGLFNSQFGSKICLLLIDDEADNASINVHAEDEEPTAINNQIRIMLSLFKKASYVGFTATPFANIFINPEYFYVMNEILIKLI